MSPIDPKMVCSKVTMSIRIILGLTVLAMACTNKAAAKREPPARAVVVWPDTVTMNEGDTLRLRAVIDTSDRKSLAVQNIIWTIDDSSVAKVFDGLVTAGRSGSTTVTAIGAGARGIAQVKVVSFSARLK